jgi:hypothetical protein
MWIAMMQYVVFWLNNIPKEDQDQSPRELIVGEQILDSKLVSKLPFRAYVQVHNDDHITNTTDAKTTGAINFGINNIKGGHKFMNLEAGEIIV